MPLAVTAFVGYLPYPEDLEETLNEDVNLPQWSLTERWEHNYAENRDEQHGNYNACVRIESGDYNVLDALIAQLKRVLGDVDFSLTYIQNSAEDSD